jgi:elongator complex protein 3
MQNLNEIEIQLIERLEADFKSLKEWDSETIRKILAKYTTKDGGHNTKSDLLAIYRRAVEQGICQKNSNIERGLQTKPIRTSSGVATVTVLTKPYPCPGQCIFCPNDVRMPKSYIASEPGAQRAEKNDFSPYLQTYNRLVALNNTGHDTSKIELIVLGGTWSYYPERYQIWFIKECFRAMNEFNPVKKPEIIEVDEEEIEGNKIAESSTYNELIAEIAKNRGEKLIPKDESATWEELEKEHKINETTHARNVGLVIETRPDFITEAEVIRMRKLGATKVQLGIQTLNDEVLMMNKRGHDSAKTAEAIKLLRQAGFKIHAHWMANLHGATVKGDIEDYAKLWATGISPDELKIYPTSIIENTELFELYRRGKYKPYSYDQLMEVLTKTMPMTPRYCRLTRIIRDIPKEEIAAGNHKSNFRQLAERELNKLGTPCECIRCREVRRDIIKSENEIKEEIIEYQSSAGKEIFISYVGLNTDGEDRLLGFLRLLLPSEIGYIKELKNKAIIREVHVYGGVVSVGDDDDDKSQHLGLGKKLIEKAEEFAVDSDFNWITVISAIGTRKYYEKRGFVLDELYMQKNIEKKCRYV